MWHDPQSEAVGPVPVSSSTCVRYENGVHPEITRTNERSRVNSTWDFFNFAILVEHLFDIQIQVAFTRARGHISKAEYEKQAANSMKIQGHIDEKRRGKPAVIPGTLNTFNDTLFLNNSTPGKHPRSLHCGVPTHRAPLWFMPKTPFVTLYRGRWSQLLQVQKEFCNRKIHQNSQHID